MGSHRQPCLIPLLMIAYFRKPLIICSSACCSVSPRVISFTICSPAILPIAASWINAASVQFAAISGTAWTLASSIMMASHSVWPLHGALPLTRDMKSCFECSFATEREMIWVPDPSPFRATSKVLFALWQPCVSNRSVTTSVAPAARSAVVSLSVESTPLICAVSISMYPFLQYARWFEGS